MIQFVRNFIRYKDLFVELVKKDIKLKYRHSYIGVLWSMLNPLLMMVVLTIVFEALFRREIEYFPVYVLTGRVLYSFFAEATNAALDSIQANAQLIRKVYVPRYIFPTTRVFSAFITNMAAIVPVVCTMLVLGIRFSFYNLLVVIPLLLLLFISVGVGLMLATFAVFFRDIKHLYSVLLTIIMYMTPIFYPESIVPEQYRSLMELNPLFPIVRMVRDTVMHNTLPDAGDLILATGYTVLFLVVGAIVFYRNQSRFIHYV
mgnify:CR=1 FL=1